MRMAKYENKTKRTTEEPKAYINSLDDETKKKDSLEIMDLMQNVTGESPIMWGNMIGFGEYHYKTKSGCEADWFLIGFAPRKQSISLYLTYDLENSFKHHLDNLGKHKTGQACLYINSLKDIDKSVLKVLIKESYKKMKEMNHIVD